MPNYHVIKNHDGDWSVRRVGSEKASGIYDRQGEAEKAAKDFARKAGGGEVRIHDLRGRIRDSDTVPPARDPNPPKDRKY